MYSLVENDVVESVKQNVRLILTTPKGSDVHRPDFGSNLFQLVDSPLNAITAGKIKAEVIEAIEKWEPRASVRSVGVQKSEMGHLTITVHLELKETEDFVEVSLWI